MEQGFEQFKKRIDDIFSQYASKTAICYMRESGGRTEYTFGDLLGTIRDFSKIMERCALREGDRVAIVTPHSPYGIVAGMSLAYWHLTAVLIDASLPAEEISRLLVLSDVRAVLTVEGSLPALPKEALSGVPALRLGTEDFSYPVFPGWPERTSLPPTPDPDGDVISILFSSGTTSQMKGVMTTYISTLLARDFFADLAGLTPDMTYLLVLPFNHVAGFTGAMTYLLTGCTLGLIENVNASKLQKGLVEFQPSYFAMVPKVYDVMAQKIRQQVHEKGRLVEAGVNGMLKLSGFLRKNFGINIGRKLFGSIVSAVFGENIFGIGTGASPCSEETSSFFLNMGLEWANLYATTETGVPITATGVHDRYPVGTVGNVNQFDEIQIKINAPDENGEGEVYVRSPLMMKGYFRDPEATAQAFDDGFFKTGDIGHIDERGYLFVTGRNKEAILLHTGKKASPADLDKIYQDLCPEGCVAACCGIPVQDKGYDEIHLFVEAGSLSDRDREKLRATLLEHSRRAGSIYQLKEIHFVERIPMTSVGKVKRYQLRDMMTEKAPEKKPSAEPAKTVLENILGMIAQYGHLDSVRPSDHLKDDLGLDSLTTLEICAKIEDTYGVYVGEHLAQLTTAEEIAAYIETGVLKRNADGHARYSVEDFPLKRKLGHKVYFKLMMGLLRTVYRIQVEGAENVPQQGSYILCPNHQTYLDSMFVWSSLRNRRPPIDKVACMAADYLLEKPSLRLSLIALGGIPVDRTGNAVPATRRVLQCLQEKEYCFLIHPEGTRTRDGNMGKFKPGAAQIAMDTNVPIIPVRIEGGYDIFPADRPLPRLFDWKHMRRYRLKISFAQPVYPEQKTAQAMIDEVENAVKHLQ